jgi:hypothetical protein
VKIKKIIIKGWTQFFNWKVKLNWKIALTKWKTNQKNEGQIKKKLWLKDEIESQIFFNKKAKEEN